MASNANPGYNSLDTRTVTRWDKVWALTMKDLTIRIFRSPISALLWTVIPIGIALILPIVYFANDSFASVLKVDPNASVPHAAPYDFFGDDPTGLETFSHIEIHFADKIYDNASAILRNCAYDQWFEFYINSDDDDDNSGEFKFGWNIDNDYNLQLYKQYHAPETRWVWQGFSSDEYASMKGHAMQQQIILKCIAGGLTNVPQIPADEKYFYGIEILNWEPRDWGQNQSSIRLILICGILWLMVILYSVSGFLLHIVNERNSGVKAIMMSMGLDATTYWISQFMSYLIESSPKFLIIAIGIGAMISDINGSSASGTYGFFAFVMSYINTAPFIFSLAPFLTSAKNAGAMSNLLKYVFPLAPSIVLIQYVNEESAATRFFVSLLPPLNFAMACRDAIRQRYTFEVMFCLFFNFPFWAAMAAYFDLVMPTASSARQKSPCFCFNCRKDKFHIQSGSQTELFSSIGSQSSFNRSSIQGGLVDDPLAPDMLGDQNILRIENLEKLFGNGVKAVNGLSLSVQENTIYGLLGFNGAGKTTTINMITGILKPSNGNIWISGMSVLNDMDRIRSTLGMCPQHNVMYDQLTVGEHMILFGRLRGMTDEDIDTQMGPLLRSVEMEEQKGTLAENLSGGQKRKLCMVQAFLGDPKLILLDEPTSGVDAESRRSMWDFILEKKQGRVIILTTHQMREADVLCDRIGIMSEGQLLVEGTPVELKQKYAVGYEIDITHRDNVVDIEGPGLEGLMKEVNRTMPETKVETLPGEWKFEIPAKYSRHISNFVAKIEDLDVASAINVHAATLESVFLRLASTVDELGHDAALNTYEAPPASAPVTGGDDHIAVRDANPMTGAPAAASEQIEPVTGATPQSAAPSALQRKRSASRAEIKAKQRSTLRLQGLQTEEGRFQRPNCFVQFILLFVKRFYITCIYWGPLFSGLVQVCLLAIIVQFMLTLAGLTDSGSQLRTDNVGKIIYCATDPSNPSQYYLDKWAHKGDIDLVSMDDCNSHARVPRDRTEEPFLVIEDSQNGVYDSPGEVVFKTAPLYSGYMFLAIQNSLTISNKDTFALGGSHVLGVNEMLSSTILVLGLGLIVGSTWYYVGQEVRDKIYEYQVQAGAYPALIWITHWIFDLGVNLLLVVIFIAICVRNGEAELIHAYQWSAFLALLSYVWIQYILVYFLKRDRLVENILSWSALMMIGVFVAEGFVLCNMFKDIGDIFETDKEIFLHKKFTIKLACILNYMLPPIQFMVGSGQGVIMWICKLLGDETSMKTYHRYNDQYWSLRFFLAFLASCGWAFIFALIHIMEKSKSDPTAPPQYTGARAPDVNQEKQAVEHLLANTQQHEYPAIVVNQLTKNFSKVSGPFRAVDGLSFRVEKGECFGLLGKNGAGKSTAINMITTLLSPSMGQSYLMGNADEQSKRDVLGICPQQDILWKKMTVYQHLMYFGLLKGVPYELIQDEIHRLATALTLEPYFHRSTGKLSGGNKRKLMLATALIGAVQIVFMDEPSSGVDPFARKCMMDVIEMYTETRAMVLTTHMMEEVEGICEKVGIMVNGDFACVNTINGLINQTNEGYQIEISLGKLHESQVQEVAGLIESSFKDTRCTERDTLVMAYQIPTSGNKLSMIFEVGDQLHEKYGCQYVISQMTMDQLFLKLTRGQRAEDQEDLVATGRAAANEQNLCCWGYGCCPREKFCGC